ncbi:MAG: class I SAM-dependent DNA methyltransferase [Gemmatimonadota bacterium]
MDKQLYAAFDAIEATHWWFVGRAHIVMSLLRRALPARTRRPRILDLGCGTGGMLLHLRTLGEIAGTDTSPDAVAIAREKSGADVRLGSLPYDIPFERTAFDVVTLLDVLEHVDDDVASLATIRDLLRPGGLLVCTVPAHQYLWSEHDVLNEHKRRYSRSELRRKLLDAGFELPMLSFYNMFFYPPVAALRLLRRGRSKGTPQLGIVPRPINALLTAVFASERYLLRLARLPIGISLIAIARKPH